MYSLMQYHFDYQKWPGVVYPLNLSPASNELRELDEALRSFKTKFSAAFARIRIELHATGTDSKKMLENVLPASVRQREEMAQDMPKFVRVNLLKTSIEQVQGMCAEMGINLRLTSYNAQQEYAVPFL